MECKDHFSLDDANQIRELLRQKVKAVGKGQNPIRSKLRRKLHFCIYKFDKTQRGFTVDDFEELIRDRHITIG